MKIFLPTVLAVSLSVATAGATTGNRVVHTYISDVWTQFQALPADYQRQHRKVLDNYLALFTNSNDVVWNEKWTDFSTQMGPQFTAQRVYVIQAMKIAEAYRACYPDPEVRIPKAATAILQALPTNAVLFIERDCIEGLLLAAQDQNHLRGDILIVGSSQLPDAMYLRMIQSKHSKIMTTDLLRLLRETFEQVAQEKEHRPTELSDVQVVDGRVQLRCAQQLSAFSLMLMRRIAGTMPDRQAFFLPAVRDYWTPITAWNEIKPYGIVCSLTGKGAEPPPTSAVASWLTLLDIVAPQGTTVSARMANTMGECINAAAFIQKANGDEVSARQLVSMWGQRVKTLRIIDGDRISIDSEGRMVEQTPAGDVLKAAPEE